MKKVIKRKVTKRVSVKRNNSSNKKSNPLPVHLNFSEELTNYQIDMLTPQNLIWHINALLNSDIMSNNDKLKYIKKITDRWFHTNIYLKMANEI